MKEFDEETIKKALREIYLKEMLQQEEAKIQKRAKRVRIALVILIIVVLISIAYFIWR